MSDNAWKEADQLVANCTHGLEFAETAEHYADLRARIRACIAYQIIERDRARQELKTMHEHRVERRRKTKAQRSGDGKR